MANNEFGGCPPKSNVRTDRLRNFSSAKPSDGDQGQPYLPPARGNLSTGGKSRYNLFPANFNASATTRVLDENPARNHLSIYNPNAFTIYVAFRESVAADIPYLFAIAAGALWEPYVPPINDIHLISGTSSSAPIYAVITEGIEL